MARLEMPTAAEMTPEQAAVCAETIAGLRGSIPPPLIPWLRSPEFARRAQKLGEFARFQTVLGQRLTELAILVCARHWTSHTEWRAHKAIALNVGVEADVVADIAAGRTPNLPDEKGRLVYEVASVLLRSSRIPDPLYRRGVEVLGETGVVELVGVLGYYCLVALSLNAFEIGLPEGVAIELNDEALNQ
jgi:4-carboxymuconolactone decarboxylase